MHVTVIAIESTTQVRPTAHKHACRHCLLSLCMDDVMSLHARARVYACVFMCLLVHLRMCMYVYVCSV